MTEVKQAPRRLHQASRAAYYKTVTQRSRAQGLLPIVWDTGNLLDRNKNAVLDAPVLAALVEGAK